MLGKLCSMNFPQGYGGMCCSDLGQITCVCVCVCTGVQNLCFHRKTGSIYV